LDSLTNEDKENNGLEIIKSNHVVEVGK